MGGIEAQPCLDTADCALPSEAPHTDGAAYDPASDSWSPISDAPVPLGEGSSAVVGDHIYLLLCDCGSEHKDVRRAFLSYDTRSDKWKELEPPPDEGFPTLTATEQTVIAYQHSQESGVHPDSIYQPVQDEWLELPSDPLAPSYDRSMVVADAGLVLFAIELVDQPGSESPPLYRAAILDRQGEWSKPIESDVAGWNPVWSRVGERIFNLNIDRVDGGETNPYGRSYATGGIFDPRARAFIPLPDPPKGYTGLTGVSAFGDRYLVSGAGWVLDVRRDEWLELTLPPDGERREAAAAWTYDALFVWGGYREPKNAELQGARLLADGWVWRP